MILVFLCSEFEILSCNNEDLHSSHAKSVIMSVFWSVHVLLTAVTKEPNRSNVILEVSDRMYCSACSRGFDSREEQVGFAV